MTTIRLMRLRIRNFKGCRSLELTPEGRSLTLYGDNAAGKTTVYDAVTWLLFGKDSRGRAEFAWKPLGPDGEVRDHGAVTEVEAVLRLEPGEGAEAEELTLRRTCAERWTPRRGAGGAVFEGHAGEYFVDGVPVRKGRFEDRVAALASEELFRALTGPAWFCGGLSWLQRREALLTLCGGGEDRVLLAAEPRFAPLLAALGRLSPEDLRQKLQLERRELVNLRTSLPARLDECARTAEGLEQLDFAALGRERTELGERLEGLRDELARLAHGSLAERRRNALNARRNELAALSQREERLRREAEAADPRPGLERALGESRRDLETRLGLVREEQALLAGLEEGQQACLRRREELEARALPEADSRCPTCGQGLPPHALEEARLRFSGETARLLAENTEELLRLRSRRETASRRVEESEARAADAAAEVRRLEGELAACPPAPAPGETLLSRELGEQRRALEEEISALAGEVSRLEGESDSVRRQLEGEISSLRRREEELDRELARQAALERTRARQEELRGEEARTGARLEELENLLELCAAFSRHKARLLEDRVNARFRRVRFRLFQEQVNGLVSECCEATVDGVPYASLNSGEQVNAGLDIIAALSRHHGVSVPVFVDNAESVTRLLPVEAQVIRLCVSPGEDTLRWSAD